MAPSEAVLVDVFRPFVFFSVKRDSDEGDFIAIFLPQRFHFGSIFPAIRAPGGPEIQDDVFASEVAQGHFFTFGCLKGESGSFGPFLQHFFGVLGIQVFLCLLSGGGFCRVFLRRSLA